MDNINGVARCKKSGKNGNNTKLVSFTDSQLMYLANQKQQGRTNKDIITSFLILFPELAELYKDKNGVINNNRRQAIYKAVNMAILGAQNRIDRIDRINKVSSLYSSENQKPPYNITIDNITNKDITKSNTISYNNITSKDTATRADMGTIQVDTNKELTGLESKEIVGSLQDLSGYKERGLKNLNNIEYLISKAIISLKQKDKFTSKDLVQLQQTKTLGQTAIKDLFRQTDSVTDNKSKTELITEALSLLTMIKESIKNKGSQIKGNSYLSYPIDNGIVEDTPHSIKSAPHSVMVDASPKISEKDNGEVGQ